MLDPADAMDAIREYFDEVTPDQLVADLAKSSPDLLLMMGIHVPENAGGFRPLPIADWLDGLARERAGWFKEIFERAKWTVTGPDDSPLAAGACGLSFAARVPVSPEVAATYLALRAAGFELITAFDPDLACGEERLTVA